MEEQSTFDVGGTVHIWCMEEQSIFGAWRNSPYLVHGGAVHIWCMDCDHLSVARRDGRDERGAAERVHVAAELRL